MVRIFYLPLASFYLTDVKFKAIRVPTLTTEL